MCFFSRFYAYKLPKQYNSTEEPRGLDFLFLTPGAGTRDWQRSPVNVNSVDSLIGRTMTQAYTKLVYLVIIYLKKYIFALIILFLYSLIQIGWWQRTTIIRRSKVAIRRMAIQRVCWWLTTNMGSGWFIPCRSSRILPVSIVQVQTLSRKHVEIEKLYKRIAKDIFVK